MIKKLTKHSPTIAIIYFLVGLIFAIIYALFYRWGILSFFSPGFYMVLISWPFQLPGFIFDFAQYGFAGKVAF